MIKKVKIKYFQSHEDSQIQFDDGMNLIIGQSDSGKSSIIRAIACCVANRWQKQQVRTGHTYCEAYVQTERGWVECQRGQGINKWKIFDGKQVKEYKSIGSGVPEETPFILGMGERKRGQIKELPNFMFQLQKHYMLSEIDGKKATSNLVARMMDNAIGLGGMQDLIKNLSVDLGKDKRRLTELETQISETKSQILDEILFESYTKLLRDCKNRQEEIKELIQLIQNSQGLHKKLSVAKERHSIVNEKILSLKDIQELQNNKKELMNLQRVLQFVKKKEKYDRLCSVQVENIQQLMQDYKSLEYIYNKIKKIKDIQKNISGKMVMYNRINFNMMKAQKEKSQKENRFQELKHLLGKCPLCETEFEK